MDSVIQWFLKEKRGYAFKSPQLILNNKSTAVLTHLSMLDAIWVLLNRKNKIVSESFFFCMLRIKISKYIPWYKKNMNSTERVNFIHFIFTLYTEQSLFIFEIFASSFLWITFILQLNWDLCGKCKANLFLTNRNEIYKKNPILVRKSRHFGISLSFYRNI